MTIRRSSITAFAAFGAAALSLAACGGPSAHNPAIVGTPGAQGAPTWPAPTNAAAAVVAAGLHMLSSEGQVEHIHIHLDVIVNGQAVPVPAGIGIDQSTQQISPVHTHDASGIIHIESPTLTSYTLGEFFSEWAQPLTATNLGPIQATSSEELRFYVNGVRYTGDPANIVLQAHQEIALIAGPPGTLPAPPTSYNFPAGL
ncbi:MAG: hypothetical protein ACYCZM_14290 [Acidimicrobiales bacterium]